MSHGQRLVSVRRKKGLSTQPRENIEASINNDQKEAAGVTEAPIGVEVVSV